MKQSKGDQKLLQGFNKHRTVKTKTKKNIKDSIRKNRAKNKLTQNINKQINSNIKIIRNLHYYNAKETFQT